MYQNCQNIRGALHSRGKDGRLRLTGNVQRERERERESKEASERLEIHEIAPQDYAAHKRVNGKGEEGGKQ